MILPIRILSVQPKASEGFRDRLLRDSCRVTAFLRNLSIGEKGGKRKIKGKDMFELWMLLNGKGKKGNLGWQIEGKNDEEVW